MIVTGVEGMTWIAGGTFAMGSDDFYPEERPVHQADVSGFLIDTYEVTNRRFRRFVDDTGYVTIAERPPDPALYPRARPEDLVPGSLVSVGSYPPNGYGIYDMAGNVSEWTCDWYAPHADALENCCAVSRRTVSERESYDREQEVKTPRKVIKGGSHLCAPNYCLRFRPAARQPETIETGTSHLGFRCERRP
jgi:formylglycine-generating enzyme required for sulfatase activity